VEGFWFFLLTGQIPTKKEAEEMVEELKKDRKVPTYVWDVLRAMPREYASNDNVAASHSRHARDSKFRRFYDTGFKK